MTKSHHEIWRELAKAEAKGKDPQSRPTPEGIDIDPVYFGDGAGEIPGQAPFTRGVKATMYAGRPWTIRQYAGFSTAEESNAFYRQALANGQQGVRPSNPRTACRPQPPLTGWRPSHRPHPCRTRRDPADRSRSRYFRVSRSVGWRVSTRCGPCLNRGRKRLTVCHGRCRGNSCSSRRFRR